MYTVDYFIKKFSKIPEGKWTSGVFIRKETGFLGIVTKIQCCAQGHCMPKSLSKKLCEDPTPQNATMRAAYPEWEALVNLFGMRPEKGNPDRSDVVIAMINNGTDKEINGYFPQPTPKQRVLAALRVLKSQPDSFDRFKLKKIVTTTPDIRYVKVEVEKQEPILN